MSGCFQSKYKAELLKFSLQLQSCTEMQKNCLTFVTLQDDFEAIRHQEIHEREKLLLDMTTNGANMCVGVT